MSEINIQTKTYEQLQYEIIKLNTDKYLLQQENKQLKDKLKGLQEERDYLFNKQSIENEYLALENKQLKEKINTYEDPEDLTLMYMWCNEKAKDKIKQLKEVIEEVREYMEKNRTRYIYQDSLGEDWRFDDLDVYSELLQILDKIKDVK